jgi:hypothetical protein
MHHNCNQIATGAAVIVQFVRTLRTRDPELFKPTQLTNSCFARL